MPELYLAAVSLIFGSGLPALAQGRWAKRGERLSVALLLAGAALALAAVLTGAFQSPAPGFAAVWSIPGGHFRIELDGLAAIFLLPALVILGLGGVYGLSYFPQARHGAAAGRLRFYYGILGAALAFLPVCRNGLLFLMAWEVMSICCFLLILTDPQAEETRRAAYVYFAATHTGTLALFAMFIFLSGGGDFTFPPAATLDGTAWPAGAVFLLAMFGFGLKAGFMPLHFWLPNAHAAAPTHVSALMSGVVIKMGIYGIVRVISFYAGPPAWWGAAVLILGVISAIMGVVFALAQHDLKRLLAYHSVENIGIILIGLGCALLGRAFHNPPLVVLGLAGALLHVVNHGLFKSLLFLGAGSVIQATGTREIDRYGGLLRAMPYTAFFFLGGAVAICGLPPLNGFVSEWLIYLGLLHTQTSAAAYPLFLAVLAIPALAMTGALAVACFVKVFGITFLGSPRVQFPNQPLEAPATMLGPMAVLFLCCLVIGLAPWTILPLLQMAVTAWLGQAAGAGITGAGTFNPLISTLAPIPWLSLGAILLLAITGGFYLRQRSFNTTEQEKRSPTWGCGYRQGTAKMQYTASSFAEMLVGFFAWGLWTEIIGGKIKELFPVATGFGAHTPELVLDRLIQPLSLFLARVSFAIRAYVHQGQIGIYLLYSALTLCLLLWWLT